MAKGKEFDTVKYICLHKQIVSLFDISEVSHGSHIVGPRTPAASRQVCLG